MRRREEGGGGREGGRVDELHSPADVKCEGRPISGYLHTHAHIYTPAGTVRHVGMLY